MRHTLLVCGVVGTLLAGLGTAHAQPQAGGVAPDTRLPDAAEKPRRPTDKPTAWEIDAHVGHANIGGGAAGSGGSLPSTGVLSQGAIAASTLYLGDGASLFNANLAAAGVGTAIVPLDALLTAAAVRRVADATLGARVYRRIQGRYGLELAGDLSFSPFGLQPSVSTAVEVTRSTYQQALGAALGNAGVGSEVTSVSTITDRPSARQMMATASVVYDLPGTARLQPYVTAGGGVAFNYGTLPTISLTGTSTLGTQTQVVYTDAVAVRFSQHSLTPIYQGGAGLKWRLTRHLGIRGDARLLLLSESVTTSLDVTPARALRSSGDAFPQVSAGTFSFGTAAPLTGGTLAGVTTFTGSGIERRIVATAGLFLRF